MPSRTRTKTTRGRAKPGRNTGNTRPVAVGGIDTPSAAASVGATSCCTAGIEYTPVLTAGPANISGIETSYAQGEPCMYATSGSGRVMKSPSRGTIRSWPVRPGKYARANISRKRCRAATSAGAVRRIRGASLPEDRPACWPETVPAIATRVRTSRTVPQAVNHPAVRCPHGSFNAIAFRSTRDASWLNDAGCLGPDDLPLPSAPFIKICVIHRSSVNDVTPGVNIEPIVAIPNHSGVTKQFHSDLASVPSDIIQLARLQRAEVFLSCKGSTGGIDQLEILTVQTASSIEVDINK